MGRPRIEWSDAQLLAIMNGIAAIDRDFPRDNARFLDGVIVLLVQNLAVGACRAACSKARRLPGFRGI